MDKVREEFEVWARSLPLANLKRHLDGYENQSINGFWSVWQAAIDSVVVELPKSPEIGYEVDHFSSGELSMHEKVRNKLKNAGIKWTE